MLWAVAGRFHFTEAELLAMPTTRLLFWYRGHLAMVDEERATVGALTNA